MKRLVTALAFALIAAGCGSDDPAGGTGATADTETTTLVDFADVTVTGPALPPVCFGGNTPPACIEPIEGRDPLVGAVAPIAEGTSFDGTPVTISHDGTNKILAFLAHWCPHCQDEVETFSEIYPDGTLPGGVELISVATGSDDRRPNYPPSEWLIDEDWAFPVLVDSSDYEVATAYGLWAYPFWVVLDGQGTVLLRHAGSLTPEALVSITDSLSAAG